jgi:hypothetical protein
MNGIVSEWEEDTGFGTEATEYRALYSRDVNNYLGVKPDGKAKLKGAYAETSLQKNPTNEICVAAVVDCLVNGVPIADTINASQDVRQFVTVRTVKGGALYEGAYLGKAIRWVYGVGRTEPIRYKLNGNKVPRSDGAMPMMDLPEAMPKEVNRWWSVREAASMLNELGYRGPVDSYLDLL